MVFADFVAIEWVAFILLAGATYMIQWMCIFLLSKKRDAWVERYDNTLQETEELYPKAVTPRYKFFFHIPWWVSMYILWPLALIASLLANGFVWMDTLKDKLKPHHPSEDKSDDLLISGIILIFISYIVSAPWPYVFFGKMLPTAKEIEMRKASEKEAKEGQIEEWTSHAYDISVFWGLFSFSMICLAFGTSLVTTILFWIIQPSVGWINIFHTIFVGLIGVQNGVIALTTND